MEVKEGTGPDKHQVIKIKNLKKKSVISPCNGVILHRIELEFIALENSTCAP